MSTDSLAFVLFPILSPFPPLPLFLPPSLSTPSLLLSSFSIPPYFSCFFLTVFLNYTLGVVVPMTSGIMASTLSGRISFNCGIKMYTCPLSNLSFHLSPSKLRQIKEYLPLVQEVIQNDEVNGVIDLVNSLVRYKVCILLR